MLIAMPNTSPASQPPEGTAGTSDVVETRLSAWVAGAGPIGASVVAGGGSGSERRTVTVQRTLTVVVRFDQAARVADVRFHASRF